MSTTPTTIAPENGFERFIDSVESFFLKAAPVAQAVEDAAVAAEPILALTPDGPEYQVAVNAIVGAQQVAQASIAASTNLTGAQKAQIAITAATPALNTILSSKGITTSTETIITNWIQNVFNILAGPIEKIVDAVSTAAS